MTKKITLLFMTALIFSFQFIYAEEAPEKQSFSIGLNIGFDLGAYKETTYSNITQKISAPKFGLDFMIKNNNFSNIISLNYDFIKPISNQTKTTLIYKEYDPVTGEPYIAEYKSNLIFHRINISYDLLYKIPKNMNNFEIEPGLSLQANAYLQFENYPSITGILSLGPSVKSRWTLAEKQSIELYCTVPFIGYGVRPPFAGCDALLMKYAEEDFMKILTLGNVLSLHNYHSILANIEYKHSLNKNWTLKPGLKFEYTKISEPKERPLYYCTTDLNIGSEVHF